MPAHNGNHPAFIIPREHVMQSITYRVVMQRSRKSLGNIHSLLAFINVMVVYACIITVPERHGITEVITRIQFCRRIEPCRKRIEGNWQFRQHATVGKEFIAHDIGHGTPEEYAILETALHSIAPKFNVLECIVFKHCARRNESLQRFISFYFNVSVHSNGLLTSMRIY